MYSEIPEWCSKYIVQHKDSVDFNVEISDFHFFEERKRNLESKCNSIMNYSYISQEEMETVSREYILCMIFLGLIDHKKAVENIKNGDKSANDGTNRQHWIPRCYLLEFAENGAIHKIEPGKIDTLTFINENRFDDHKTRNFTIPPQSKIHKNIGLNDIDFCEAKERKGIFYSSYFEIILSKIEGDFRKIPKDARKIENLWHFLVLSTFFLTFSLRTLWKKENGYAGWNRQESLLYYSIPEIVTEFDLLTFAPQSAIPSSIRKRFGGNMNFPFNEHPIYEELENDNILSLWAIYTPDCFLWFRNKKSKINTNNINTKLLANKLHHTLGDNSEKSLYFKPNSLFWKIDWEPQ